MYKVHPFCILDSANGVMADTSKSVPANDGEKRFLRTGDQCGKEDIYGGITEQLLEELKRVYQESGKVTDEVLSALSSVLQAPLLPALDLVDSHSVTLMECPAGRKLYQVVGSSGTPYTCFTSSSYCSCPAYRFSVLTKEEHAMCKHVLAVKISDVMEVTKRLEISNQELAEMIKNLE